MSIQFILGRSGTGKTSYCIKAIIGALLEADDNRPLILLVPEQATYQAERAIFNDKRIAGYSSGTQSRDTAVKSEPRLNVLSFDRLQFLLLGRNTARSALSRIGQQMIIQRILRDNSSKLKVFGASASYPGLGRQMAETIAEMHQFAKTPDDIDQLLGQLQKGEQNNLTALKFADIGLVFKEYLKFIEGRFIDPDVQLAGARGAVAGAAFVKGARLWVDGFAGFTTSELAILAELLKVVEDAHIALCLDWSDMDLANPDIERLDPVGLFDPTQRTYADLIELIKKFKLKLAKPKLLEEPVRFFLCPPLAHIERNIFRPEPVRIPASDNIRIVSAPNARCEVQFVAREVLRLIKQEDYRYRDIGVIAPDIDAYQHYIKAYFDDYAIPFFIDKRKPLNQHPVVQLICSALRVVIDGFSHGDIFAFLKTGLVPIGRYEVDLLENYCLAFGVMGSDWQGDKDWHFLDPDDEDFDEELVNQVRMKITKPLIELRERICSSDNHEETIDSRRFTNIIFDFLDELGVRERISDWIEQAVTKGDYATIEEHQQFFSKLIDIFDELVEVFGEQKMQCRDFISIINFAFSQLSLAFIPPSLDQVLVGTIERSRHPDLKAVFLVGATQKHFPSPVSYNRLLTDEDRKVSEEANFQMAASMNQMLTERQYLAYIAFTRPSQFLYVTYPSTDDKASAVPRSQFIADLESLFENLSEESVAGEQINIEKINSESELADLLCASLGKDSRYRETNSDEQHKKLLDDICSDTRLAKTGLVVKDAIEYDNSAHLDKKVVRNLLGREMKSSATRLKTFAACPYRYFARYTLELEERREFKLRPLDVGDFYHRVLDALLKRLNQAKKDFATAGDKELLELLQEQISKVIKESSFISNFAAHSPHNTFIINSASWALEDCVLAIAKMVRAGDFRPRLSEVSFGDSCDVLGEYKVGLSNNRLLVLSGKIDRLDIADIDGEKAAIIFDYKRREEKFDWSEFYHGLDMQLPIYMLAVHNTASPQYKVQNVAGAFYMPVEVIPKQVELDELSEETDSFDYKAKGILNGKFTQQLDRKASKESKFYNFYVTKDGQPYGNYNNRGALKPTDFEKVLKFTERKIVELAEEIIRGKIDVKPYRLGTDSPCSRCEYRALCRFDWQINNYNFLEKLNKSQILEKMGAVDG